MTPIQLPVVIELLDYKISKTYTAYEVKGISHKQLL